MKILTNENTDELMEITANNIIDTINELSEQESIKIGLVGGRSVTKLYEKLAQKECSNWEKCHFFIIDERNLPMTDHQSNFKEVNETLLKTLLEKKLITTKNIHPINTHPDKPEDTIYEYKMILDQYDNQLDIAILSSGEDGHVAAIYPFHSYTEKSVDYITDSPKPPPKRFTMTPEFLNKSKNTYLLFIGEGKKEALKNFREGKLPEPLTFLKELKNLLAITDQK